MHSNENVARRLDTLYVLSFLSHCFSFVTYPGNLSNFIWDFTQAFKLFTSVIKAFVDNSSVVRWK